jgi:hypothetical protein
MNKQREIKSGLLSHYYWYKGEKQYITPNPEKYFVLFKEYPRESDMVKLGLDKTEQIYEVETDSSLIGHKEGKNYWSIIKGNISEEKIVLLDYYAPFFFGTNEKEVGLSHLFYDKLYKHQDIKILEELASKQGVKVLGYNQFMPLWYTLSCDKNSNGNALENANIFYETGFFEASQPDLMEEELLQCANDPYFINQWNLYNIGQYGGSVGSDIKVCNAWTLNKGNGNIIVAIINQGIEMNHPDLLNISPVSFDAQSGTTPSQLRGDMEQLLQVL